MKKYFLGPLLALMLVFGGCAGTGLNLDSNEDRLAAAEITFANVAELAIKLHPRISESKRADVVDAVTCLHELLIGARLAHQFGDDVDFNSKVGALQKGISVLRPILLALEENEDADSFEFNCAA